MAKKKPVIQRTADERREKQRLDYKAYRLQLVVGSVNRAITWGGAAAIAFMGYMAVDTLAGQTTAADIGVRFLGNLQVSQAVAWAFGISAGAYGWSQRKLRKDTTERLASRNAKLEEGIDPKRTSSKLTRRGDTNPGDRL